MSHEAWQTYLKKQDKKQRKKRFQLRIRANKILKTKFPSEIITFNKILREVRKCK